MKVIKLEKIDLDELSQQLSQGKVVAFPTETAYGLLADATNAKAVEKVYKIKGRDYQKAMPVVCADISQVNDFFVLDEAAEKIGNDYWPGPLGLKLSQKGELQVNKNDESVVVRVTSHAQLKQLIKKFKKPLIATSANLARSQTLYDSKAVYEEFKSQALQPDILVDAGELPEIAPSTIIEIVDGKINVLREGPIEIISNT